jgi:hypothetical protein
VTPLRFTDAKLALVLAAARQIANDDDRDEYFTAVAAALRSIPDFSDSDVAAIVAAAFSKYAEGSSP